MIIMMKNVIILMAGIQLMLGIMMAVGILFTGACLIVLGRKLFPISAS
jgi:hypothetical protein